MGRVQMPDLEVLERRRNPLLHREEVLFRLRFDGSTPSRRQIREEVSRFLGVEEERVIVRKITQEYGMTEARALILVYDDPNKAKEIEPEHIIKRHEKKAEAQAEAG